MPHATLPPLSDRTFEDISALLRAEVGLALTADKKPLVSARLSGRIRKLGIGGFDEYYARLCRHDGGAELQTAVDLLTTHETYFFREPAHFALLERTLRGARPREFSVWSAASSYGDEAFSIAMLLADLQLQGFVGPQWSVLGTDVSDQVLRSAVQGIFPVERLREVTADRLKRYWLRGEGEAEGFAKVRPELAEHVRFGMLNLCEPYAGIGSFDAVFLRNVLIYFDTPTKTEVVDRALAFLRPGGLFFVGTAEGRIACDTPLASLAPGVFRKLGPAAQARDGARDEARDEARDAAKDEARDQALDGARENARACARDSTRDLAR